MKITFLGAAQTVTGSKYLVEDGGGKVLVDCGMFQGVKELRLHNRDPFPVPSQLLDAVVLTHAHIDHSGLLPALVRAGFSGPVYCTAATRDLCEILLRDSAKIQREDANYTNKHHLRRSEEEAKPLFSFEDVDQALGLFQPVAYGEKVSILNDVSAKFFPAGHILGASSIQLEVEGTSVLFSGDVGRPEDPILKAPAAPPESDYLVIESTYGDRRHEVYNPLDLLESVIVRTIDRGGRVLIPAFAVGRTQLLLHLIQELQAAGRIPAVPVYLDSPMAINVTDIYCNHQALHKLTPDECRRMCNVAEYLRTPDESRSLNGKKEPMIVIAASGMITGGRIIHHLKHGLSDPRNTVLLPGFQAAGTRGRSLMDGADAVKIHGSYVPVCADIVPMTGLSAHADYRELLAWAAEMPSPPKRTFITHGEPHAADALRRRIEDGLGWDVTIASRDQSVPLGVDGSSK